MPWPAFNPKLLQQQAKRYRLVRKATAGCGTLTKQQLRDIGAAAVQQHPIKRCPSPTVDQQQINERQRKLDWQAATEISKKM